MSLKLRPISSRQAARFTQWCVGHWKMSLIDLREGSPIEVAVGERQMKEPKS